MFYKVPLGVFVNDLVGYLKVDLKLNTVLGVFTVRNISDSSVLLELVKEDSEISCTLPTMIGYNDLYGIAFSFTILSQVDINLSAFEKYRVYR